MKGISGKEVAHALVDRLSGVAKRWSKDHWWSMRSERLETAGPGDSQATCKKFTMFAAQVSYEETRGGETSQGVIALVQVRDNEGQGHVGASWNRVPVMC